MSEERKRRSLAWIDVSELRAEQARRDAEQKEEEEKDSTLPSELITLRKNITFLPEVDGWRGNFSAITHTDAETLLSSYRHILTPQEISFLEKYVILFSSEE